MRTKFTLLLVFLNVALFAYILHVRQEWITDSARIRDTVLPGDQTADIQALTLGLGDSPPIELRRSGQNAWSIIKPVNWPANPNAVSHIINALQFLKHYAVFNVAEVAKGGQHLADYGLERPAITLGFVPAGGTTPITLRIGAETKVDNRFYLLSPDGTQIHIIGKELPESLHHDLDQLRTDALFTIPVIGVRSLSLQAANSSARVRLQRDGARWTIESPIRTRASKPEAELALNALTALRAGHFLGDRDVPAEGTGLKGDAPFLRITLEGDNRRETLLIGQPVSAEKPGAAETVRYAQLEERTQLFTVAIPSLVLDTLKNAQETLRETRILDLTPAAVTTLTLRAPGQPALLLQRLEVPVGSPPAWQIDRSATPGTPPVPAEANLVEQLLNRLADLRATPPSPGTSGFVADAPDQDALEKLGFNLPEREITLTLTPGDSAAATPATPPPAPAPLTLQIALGAGGSPSARVLGQTFVYAVPADTLSGLPVAARFYRNRLLRTLPEGAQITGLTLTPEGDSAAAPVYTHTLAAGETWAQVLAAEPAGRRAALEQVFAQLRTLRAKQFVSETFTDTVMVGGTAQPWKYRLEATLTLTGGTGAQTSTTTLLLSERTGGGTQFAGSREFGVVFELEQPLLDALWTLTYGPRDPGPPAVPATTNSPASPETAAPTAAAPVPAAP